MSKWCLFAGVKLEGGKIAYLDERNTEIYKQELTPEQMLFEERDIPESVASFHNTVTKYSPSMHSPQ